LTIERIYNEGFSCAVAGGRRADNPYARGWARFSALVLPDTPAAVWDRGYLAGLEMPASAELDDGR
jgi:hypothetical protein